MSEYKEIINQVKDKVLELEKESIRKNAISYGYGTDYSIGKNDSSVVNNIIEIIKTAGEEE